MTRHEAKLIAEELYKLIHNEIIVSVKQTVSDETEEWMGTEEAAAYMGISVRNLKNRISDIPHVKVGRRNMFTKKTLNQYLKR